MHRTMATLGVNAAAGSVRLPDFDVTAMLAYHLGKRGRASEASL